MRPSFLNVLTPWGWTAAALLALLALILAAGAAGFRWDPLDLQARRLDRARADLAAARSELSARTIEQSAEAEQRARLDVHHQQARAVTAIAAAAEAEARNAHDAQNPLDDERARRLHDLDRRLCDAAPGLAGCAAAPEPAG